MMTDLSFPHVPRFPYNFGNLGASLGSDTLMTLNGAGDKLAFLFQATSTTPPDKALFVCHSFTSSGAVDVTLEPLSSGAPSGTPVSGTGTGTTTVSGTGVQTVTGLAGSGSLSVGVWYAVVITAATGFTGNFTLKTGAVGSGVGGVSQVSYMTKDSAGAWSGESQGNPGMAVGLFYSGDVPLVVQGFAGAYTGIGFQTVADSTNPDERGMLWEYPVGIRIAGIAVLVGYGSGYDAGEDWRVGLYSDPLGSPSRDGHADGGASGSRMSGNSRWILWEEGAIDVAANTPFALTIKATSTGSIQLLRLAYPSALAMQSLFGTSGVASVTRNNDSGAFSSDNTMAYGAVPIITGIDVGTASAGMVRARLPAGLGALG